MRKIIKESGTCIISSFGTSNLTIKHGWCNTEYKKRDPTTTTNHPYP